MYKISKDLFQKFQQQFESNEYEAFQMLHDQFEDSKETDNIERYTILHLVKSILSFSAAMHNNVDLRDDDCIYEKLRDLICNAILKTHGIYHIYSETSDLTFIMQASFEEDGTMKSEEVIGFYYGSPNYSDTLRFANKREVSFY